MAETEEGLWMSAKERDRLKVLHEVRKRHITQRQAAAELGISVRWVGMLLKRLRVHGDRGLRHRLRGKRSNRKAPEELKQRAVELFRQKQQARLWHDYGPTLAAEELSEQHGIHISRETLRHLGSYLEQHGRPVAVYTDKASLFQATPRAIHHRDAPAQQLTQIGRALKELNVEWIAAHSPQAKGRIERSFQTAQDRLVKGLRQIGAEDLETANQYLQQVYIPFWNRRFRREPQLAGDAHRPVPRETNLDSVLSIRRSRTLDQ